MRRDPFAPARAAARGLIFVLLFIALQRVSFLIHDVQGVSLWYLPAGLSVAYLVRFGAWQAGWVYLAIAGAGWLQSPVALNHPAALIGTAGYLLGAHLLRQGTGWQTGRLSLQDILAFPVLASLTAGVSALTAPVLYLAGDLMATPWLSVVFDWWVGDMVGIVVVTPPLLLLSAARQVQGGEGRRSWGGLPWDVVAPFILVSPLTWLVFTVAAPQGLRLHFLCFVPLLWLAIRSGLTAAVAGSVLTTLCMALLMPQAALPHAELVSVQLLVLTLTLTALIVGAGATERQRDRARLMHLALTDPLTGLPNRHAFLKAAQDRLRTDPDLLITALDVSRLKWINDTLGQASGDEVLVTFARRLQASVPHHGVVARLNGGMFAVACSPYRPGDVPSEPMATLRAALSVPFALDGAEIQVHFLCGTARSTPGTTVETLMQRAEEALATARQTGVDVIDSSAPTRGSDGKASFSALHCEHDLRRALDLGGQLALHYQPQFELATLNLTSFEALIRWHHPERGLLAPAEFLPVAERTRLIIPLSVWVLQEACRQLAHWLTLPEAAHLRVAVNVSPGHLHTGQLHQDVQQALAAAGLPGDRLELELTESSLLLDPARANAQLALLHAQGVRLALDDFGTGYSSIRHLRDFQVSTLKIDRSFVRRLGEDARDRHLVTALTALGHELGTSVLAEGAESMEVVDLLRTLGCDSVQGYELGRPLPAADATQLIRRPPAPRPAGDVEEERPSREQA
ncbi:putative bifunctional diguanylate cyclase/phosphodiesterase [Deinococcus radiotolerans]|uniref:Diguanylate cyclase/phosphodiesterase n=1 Tax=Deinococcus radiotolerans TaxID=1309407 RepID=A0ABQ2FRG4_9DEIO|nr:EAL domain-containing protein [Deinococcus radiotolerans]GGL19618.1 hypothetical protein GCM10010844_43230 [Deinococcus radiotolerans]